MLTIHYGDMENVIYNTSVYFDNVYSPQWFQDAFAQRVIKSIDKGTVVGPKCNRYQDSRYHSSRKTIQRHQNTAAYVLYAEERI